MTTALCPRCGMALNLDGLCPRCVALDFLAPLAPDSLTERRASTDGLRYFGDYEILNEIAHGGMGVVYRARQISLNRVVAVKMLLVSPRLDPSFRERFHAEARAAASLHHPSIVAIHDIGEHDGTPYFSMDYIEGRTLAELTLEGPRPAREAAGQILQAAEAVAHAHARGVIHRDLKPSNVIVDNDGQVHVTDFGLAKRLDLPNDLTLTGHVIGTPGYMAPEQAGGAAVLPTRLASERSLTALSGSATEPVQDRRSSAAAVDIYSLGATLYHLLTGRPPFTGGSTGEILRQLAQADPVAPSRLNPSVPLDLETVTLKCLEKEPTRRYACMNELADELGRFLRGEAIRARPLSSPEKAWRWSRRNPALASTIAACLCILLTGVAGILWQLRQTEAARAEAVQKAREEAAQRQRAEANERRATTEASRSAQVAKFMKEMLGGVGPKIARGRDTTLLREILNRAAERVESELAGQPEIEADLRQTLGTVYLEIGDYQAAESMHRAALALRKQRFGLDHPLVTQSLVDVGSVLIEQGNFSKAEPLMREALALRRKLGDEALIADSLYTLSWVIMNLGKQPEAELYAREAVAMQKRRLGPEHPLVAFPLNLLGHLLQQQNKLSESEKVLRETLALRRKFLPPDDPDLAQTLDALGNTLMHAGKLDEADAPLNDALKIREKVLGHDHTLAGRSYYRLGMLRERQGRLDEAEKFYRESIAIYASRNDVTFGRAGVLDNLGALLTRQGRPAEAEPLQREALALYEKLGTAYGGQASAQVHLAETLSALKRFAEAETLLLTRHQAAVSNNEHAASRTVITDLVALYRDWGKTNQSSGWQQKLEE